MGLFSAIINGVEHVADDFEKLVSKGVEEMESLGIGVFDGLEGFIRWLIEMNTDPVRAIASMINHVEEIGGEVLPTLETIAHGIADQGLSGFVTSKLDVVVAPAIDALKKSNSTGTQVVTVHQQTAKTMKVQLDALTVAQAGGVQWSGSSALEMTTQFNSLSDSLSGLNVNIGFDSPQEALNTACLIALAGIGAFALFLAIDDLLLVLVEAVVAVVTAGGALVIEGPVDVGLAAAEVTLILGLILADLVAWAVGSLAIYGVQHWVHTSTSAPAASKPQVMQLNLPKSPDLTPEQQAAVEDLVRELADQLGVTPESLEQWLQLIAQALGTSVSASTLKSIVRCMAAKGYLSGDLTKVWNSVSMHLTPRDLQGAWGDNNGYDTGGNHKGEVGDALQSLQNYIDNLDAKIADFRTSPVQRAFYQGLRNAAQNTIDYVNKLINLGKKQGPSTDDWPDPKGQVPFAADIIKASGCAPA